MVDEETPTLHNSTADLVYVTQDAIEHQRSITRTVNVSSVCSSHAVGQQHVHFKVLSFTGSFLTLKSWSSESESESLHLGQTILTNHSQGPHPHGLWRLHGGDRGHGGESERRSQVTRSSRQRVLSPDPPGLRKGAVGRLN